MATCHNKNTVEYKALLAEYNSPFIVDAIINDWQKIESTDSMPTLTEAVQITKDQEKLMQAQNIKQGELVLKNLQSKGFLNKIGNEYFIMEKGKSIESARATATLIRNYLKWNGFSEESILFKTTKNRGMYRAIINENVSFKAKMRTSFGYNASLPVLDHLMKMFPDTKYMVLDEASAKELYNEIPHYRKKDMDWKKVNSFFYGGTAVLIKGRVTQATAIEEVLHPFVDSLQLDNEELFNRLHKEAEENFPDLKVTIDEEYSSIRFTDTERKLELVTQALANHFSEEFDTQPTASFLRSIREFLTWFSDIIKSLYSALTGKKLTVNQLNSTMTLSDISRMLNTEDLTFELNPIISNLDVRYSLSKSTKATLNTLKQQSVTVVQSEIIDQLFHQSISSKSKFDLLSTSRVLKTSDGDFVNVDTGEEYTSLKNIILGAAKNPFRSDEKPFGENTIDTLEKLVLGVPFVNSGLKDNTYKDIYNHMLTRLDGMRDDRSIFIPNVILSNDTNKSATMIDLLKVDPFGNIQIINFEASGLSVKTDAYSKNKFDLGAGSVLKSEDMLDSITPKILNSLELALASRMIENLGFSVEHGSMSLHFRKVKNTNTIEGTTLHPRSENLLYVNKIIPFDVATENQIVVDEILNQIRNPEEILDWEDDVFTEDEINYQENQPLYDAVLKGLSDFNIGLISQEESILNGRNILSLDKSKTATLRQISMTRSLIENLAINPDQIHTVHLDLVKQSIDQIDEFMDYIGNPNNFSKKEYISKVLHWQKFVENFRGLAFLTETDGLSKTQLSYITKLQNKLDKIVGTTRGDGTIKTKGQIGLAIDNFVRATIKEKSKFEWTEEELDQMMTTVKDMDYVSYQTGTMATSRDNISALMDKIFKKDKQIVLDRVERRVPRIKRAALKLKQLSAGAIDYSFLVEYDENGLPTGQYTKKIGKEFKRRQKELSSKLTDENGGWKAYIDIEDINEATPEQLAYNKQLYIDREAYYAFRRAENITDSGPVDGEYYEYIDEFKRARARFEIFVPNANGGGFYAPKATVSNKAYLRYLAKYYNSYGPEDNIQRPEIDGDGNFTGQMIDVDYASYVKPEMKQVREETSKGENMRNPKWEKLQKPVTALEKAQSEYYNMFIDIYEGELLNKLPENVKMIGKLPAIIGGPVKGLKNKPVGVGSIYSKFKTKFRNFFNPSTTLKRTFTDEFGDIITDSLPLYYTGNIVQTEDIQKEYAKLEIEEKVYQNASSQKEQQKSYEKIRILRGNIKKLEAKPSALNLNLDITESLLKFSAMAENYEVMSQSEDTFHAMIEVIKNRTTTDSKGATIMLDDDEKEVGKSSEGRSKMESNVVKRAKKWMKMTYYNNDKDTKTFFDKITSGLITATSLAYVGFNIFGNFNNYVFGRVSNAIETAGGRYYNRKAMMRAVMRFNAKAIPDLLKGMANNLDGDRNYKDGNNRSKYNAMVLFLRMLDNKQDMRESTYDSEHKSVIGTAKDLFSEGGADNVSRFVSAAFDRLHEVGYIVQDAGEFNVQSKIGHAIIESTTLKNSTTGETLSYYDAYQWDNKALELKLKEGFDTVIFYNETKEHKVGPEGKFKTMDDVRYELRNYIREVNIQIHGNYAHEDRMVMQSTAVGQLAAQFHKWVAPSIKARFRPAYFDENLGWMEGRYLSFWNFMKYATKNIANIGHISSDYKAFNGEQGQLRLQNVHRTLGEIGIIMTTFALRTIFGSMMANDDDDDDMQLLSARQDDSESIHMKRIRNALLYQLDKTHKELILYVPIPGVGGLQQMYQMFKSPIASTRTLGELGQALEVTVGTGLGWAFMSDEDFLESSYVYKRNERGHKKGDIKLNKEWGDALPILYTINRYKSFDQNDSFFIK